MGKKKKNAVRLKAADGIFRLDYGSSPDADELRRRFRGFFYARKSEGEAPTNVSARAALGGKVLELNELLLRDPKAALAGGVSNCYIVILQPSPQQLRQFVEGKEAAEGARGTARTRPAADADADAPQQPAKRRRGEGGGGVGARVENMETVLVLYQLARPAGGGRRRAREALGRRSGVEQRRAHVRHVTVALREDAHENEADQHADEDGR